ncbi:hypothetical protein VIN01S_00860 [Vibrio inusitatus NBRC 102082]|uniref:Uncharacterized protein n=1 Tax=Vibrio inusitatus NBRC 102082 TaxID=1219070 RepID=A0A4Y3HRA5_9VIBR|nr:DUF3427 domain-containing protein [Vibrio inusitatus]GEA49282.1 hypothetical protein VIN01S_00860 [Vibrio inusitatus NBRC 102082]
MKFELNKKGEIKKLTALAEPLTPEDIVAAIFLFEEKGRYVETYAHSTKYDLVYEGKRYPPKAIFGLALSSRLGQKIKSGHFSGGPSHPCFKVLKALGFTIAKKRAELALYDEYSRQDISELFDPDYEFKQGAGRWGISGIISGKPGPDDVVFIVTLEERDGNEYDDFLTEDGVLFWKSQNRHAPQSSLIQRLSAHDPDLATIYLFMRTSEKDDYTFLGPLALRDWDPMSSNPVHFQWDLLSWPLPKNIEKTFSKHIRSALVPTFKRPNVEGMQLKEEPAPYGRKKRSSTRRKSKGTIDWSLREKRNRELGLAGEYAVIDYEKHRLISAGEPELAEQIKHIALVDSSAGYDVQSYNIDGSERHIEVKTTTQSKSAPFYISSNEVKVSSDFGGSYWIYRLYGYDVNNKNVSFYMKNGPVEENFELEPDTFKAFAK